MGFDLKDWDLKSKFLLAKNINNKTCKLKTYNFISLVLLIFNIEMVLREFLSISNLLKTLNCNIYKLIKIVIVVKYKKFLLIFFLNNTFIFFKF